MPWLRSLPFLCLLAITGCASVKPSAYPASLLLDTPHPVIDVSTNGGLARGIQAYRRALNAANDDKAALREHLKD